MMKWSRGIAIAALCFLLVGSWSMIAQPSDAASGSITIDPGQTKYISFGTVNSGDVLLWDLTINTWSTVFTYWLEKPSGVHLTINSLYSGMVVDLAGEWKIGFSIDPSGYWSATVYYEIYAFRPTLVIVYPQEMEFINDASIIVSGTVDRFANNVSVSLDNVHYDAADLYMGSWNKNILLGDDGAYTIYAMAELRWGDFKLMYSDSVTIMLDTTPPELGVITPANNSYVAGSADLSWQCSDEWGIASREVKVDLLNWITVEGDEYRCSLSDGYHTLRVRVTDLAGNSAIASIIITSDTTRPSVAITSPIYNATIREDAVKVTWTGSDALSGIDHYEIRITGGNWINVGLNTSYIFTGLIDGGYYVIVKAIDRSGNSAESGLRFEVCTNIWSTNGPYGGIPLFILIATVLGAAVISVLLYRRKRAHRQNPPQGPN